MTLNFYERLNHLESLSGSNDKEDYLVTILQQVKNAEKFFRFTFNEDVFGVKEQTFNNIYGPFTQSHISEYLAMNGGNDTGMTVDDLLNFGNILLNNSGFAQQEQIERFFGLLSKDKGKWFCRAILKDLRCGVQVKTLNRALKRAGLKIIKKFSLQLCDKLDLSDITDITKKVKFPCSMECKYDGIRLQATVSTNNDITTCSLLSRRGKDKTHDYPEVVKALTTTFAGENLILDGEIISSSFQDLTRKDSASQKNYVIFDLLVDENLKYLSRWDNLTSLAIENSITVYPKDKINIIKNKLIYLAEHYSCNNIRELRDFYDELNEREEEGVIVKLDDSPYVRNSRKYMFKCKKVYTTDLLCVGYKTGTGKRSGMVSTLCLQDESKTVTVDVGSGIDDETSYYLTAQMTADPLNPEFIGKIVEIKYNELTSTGSIRFPRFVTIRDDKEEPDNLSNVKVRQ